MNIKFVISYDGTAYKGFQRQTKWSNTVQSVLEFSLNEIFENRINLIGAGRTDAGVHAIGQVANCIVDTRIPVERLPEIINNRLPKDIRVLKAEKVNDNFHARKHALMREYKYYFYVSGIDIFPGISRYSYVTENTLDVAKAHEACNILRGKLECSSFMTTGSSCKTTFKNIKRCSFEESSLDFVGFNRAKGYVFTIEADSFLYNMVRIIVANIAKVASGKMSLEEFKRIVEARDRKVSGIMFPPNGLFLTKITY